MVTAVTAARGEHRYESCRDKECERIPCRAFREGYGEGYDDGFPDGIAACPREHK